MSTILIVDDQSISRMILEELMRSMDENIQVESYGDPVKALERAKSSSPDLVLTDYKMPNMDGIEFTQWLRQIPTCSDIPVVIVTCVEDKNVRYRALEAGATDFLTKPIDHHECRARCRNLLQLRGQQVIIKDRARWLEQEINNKTHDLQLREQETILRLAKAGEYRDEDTGRHVERMALCARVVAEEMDLPEKKCEIIEHAAPMHDIGKIGIPDHVLLKQGKLTPSEWEAMKTHTQIGYEILRDSPSEFLQIGAIIALNHHERFNGNGYPAGIAGTDIPLEARLVAVSDVFDALMSARPYKAAWTLDKALEYLLDEKGKHFDPDCVDAFIAQLDRIISIQNQLRDPNEKILQQQPNQTAGITE